VHVLLERALAVDDPARKSLETLFTDKGSFVRSAQFCISTSLMAGLPGVEGAIRHRIADPPESATSAAPSLDCDSRGDAVS
jgi:hypothetical protein